MSKNPEIAPKPKADKNANFAKKPDYDEGLKTGVKYWIVFMLGLAVLGYSPFLSISFGAIGGIASGVIAAWLKPKDVYKPSKAEKQAQEDEEKNVSTTVAEPTRRVRFRKHGSPTASRQHQSRGSRRFGWLFRRRP